MLCRPTPVCSRRRPRWCSTRAAETWHVSQSMLVEYAVVGAFALAGAAVAGTMAGRGAATIITERRRSCAGHGALDHGHELPDRRGPRVGAESEDGDAGRRVRVPEIRRPPGGGEGGAGAPFRHYAQRERRRT